MPKFNAFLHGDDEIYSYNLKKKQLRMNYAFDTNVVDTAYAKCDTQINDWNGNHEFNFADTNGTAILGLDFFKKFNASMNFSSNELKIKDNENEYSLKTIECNAEESTEEVDDEKTDAIVSSDIIITATSEKIIDIEIVQRLDCENPENLFEPNRDSELQVEGQFLYNCLNIVSGGYKTCISVLNVSDNDFKLSSAK